MMEFDVAGQLRQFLDEDIGDGDITSDLLPKRRISARIISREEATVAGTMHARSIFGMRGCVAEISRNDGSRVGPGQTIMTVAGYAGDILACERTALNLLSRMSGISTMTAMLVKEIPEGTSLYATRKTAPGLRYFDKEAVMIGGGKRHRMRLDEMIMIKDNHIAVEGSIRSIMRKAKRGGRRFEVEVETVQDALLAAGEGAGIIMLDNFTPARIAETVRMLEERGLRKDVLLEASGGITPGNIAGFGRTGVDIISVGYITSSAAGIDMSLEI